MADPTRRAIVGTVGSAVVVLGIQQLLSGSTAWVWLPLFAVGGAALVVSLAPGALSAITLHLPRVTSAKRWRHYEYLDGHERETLADIGNAIRVIDATVSGDRLADADPSIEFAVCLYNGTPWGISIEDVAGSIELEGIAGLSGPMGPDARYPYGRCSCGPRSTGDFRFVQPVTPMAAELVRKQREVGRPVRAQLGGVEICLVREDSNEPFEGKVWLAASVSI